MSVVEKKHQSLFVSLFLTFVLFGISSTAIGAALPTMLAEFHWSYGIAGILLATGSAGSFIAIYLAGRIIERLEARTVLAVGFALCALSLGFFGASPEPLPNIILYFLLGCGQGFLEVGVNWAVLRMDGKGSGRPMSVMHGSFSVGAVAGPFLVGILLGARLSWTFVYRATSILLLALFALMFVLPFKRLARLENGPGQAQAKEGSAIRALAFLALLFYVGTELGLSNWAAEYFVKTFGLGAAKASFVVSVFWGGIALGRFGIPAFLGKTRPDRLFLALSLGLTVGTGALAILGAGGPAAAGLALIALCLSGLAASAIYPSVVTVVGKVYEANPGPAIGLASAGGALGALAFPFAMSGIASARGVHAGFVFYALLAIACFASCMVLFLALRRRQKGRA